MMEAFKFIGFVAVCLFIIEALIPLVSGLMDE